MPRLVPGSLKCPRNVPQRLSWWNNPELGTVLGLLLPRMNLALIPGPHVVMGGPGQSQQHRKTIPTLAVLSGLLGEMGSRLVKGGFEGQ